MPLLGEQVMRLALRLAARGEGKTRPNPMVGAIVVHSGRIVGQGYHRKAGQPHAEVLALRQAGSRAKGGTLYVTLEPCHHFGRTPPCTEAIVRSGIRRVVAATIDPNPLNQGRGVRFLRSRGIQTRVGLLQKEARELNKVFATWMRLKRPFVTVKVAQSLDGKIATRTGDSRWVSGPAARAWVHRLRAQVDAILVGAATVLKDNPRLTARTDGAARQPIKIIVDSHLRTSPGARIFSSGRVIVATTTSAPHSKENRLLRAGAEVLRLPARRGRVHLKSLLRELARREISHLLIEGGGEVIASAFEARAVDRFCCIIAPKVIGGRAAPTAVGGEGIAYLSQAMPLKDFTVRRLGSDLLLEGDVYRDY